MSYYRHHYTETCSESRLPSHRLTQTVSVRLTEDEVKKLREAFPDHSLSWCIRSCIHESFLSRRLELPHII